MTSTPSPGSHPHTDLLAKADSLRAALEREPAEWWDDEHVLDNGMAAVRIRDLATALRSQIAATDKAETDRDRLAARVETLEGSLAMIRRRAVEHRKGLTPGYVLAAIDTPECDLPQRQRASVAPTTDGLLDLDAAVLQMDLNRVAYMAADAEVEALRAVVRHFAAYAETQRPTFPPFRTWEDEDWADSGWTPAEAAAIRAALVAPDTPTSPTDTGDPT